MRLICAPAFCLRRNRLSRNLRDRLPIRRIFRPLGSAMRPLVSDLDLVSVTAPLCTAGRRAFLKRYAMALTGALLPGLASCVPAAYAAWNVSIPVNESDALTSRLVSLQGVFIASGYVHFQATSGVVASYWLRPTGRITIDIKETDAENLLIILSESGEKTFSQIGKDQVVFVAEQLHKVFGVARVVSCKSLGLRGCVV